MNGEKIEQACSMHAISFFRNNLTTLDTVGALKLFLASLPTKSKLNIVRFGDQFSFLWPVRTQFAFKQT